MPTINKSKPKLKRYQPKYPPAPKIEMASAYWIDPDGKIIAVDETHIAEIFRKPENFGLSMDYIESVYKKYKEPLWSEGNAREKILLHLVNDKGYIRIRQYRNQWVANANPLSNSQKDYLYEWAKAMIRNGESKYSVISVNGVEYSFEELSKYEFKEKKLRKRYVTLEEIRRK